MQNLSRGQLRKTRRKSSMFKDMKNKEIKMISVTLTPTEMEDRHA